MPLHEGKSPKAFEHNIKTEMHAGKPLKQSLAIAYAMKRKHKAHGGMLHEAPEQYARHLAMGGHMFPEPISVAKFHEDEKKTGMGPETHISEEHYAKPHMAHGGMFYDEEMASGYLPMPANIVKPNAAAHSEDEKLLNQHGEMDEGPEDGQYAYGGYAHGDIIGRILHKRYSEGGRVANHTSAIAGSRENDFDDLALRDDLKSTYGEDDNAGDSLGDAREDHDRADIVARIMRKRARQHNPVPA